MSTVLILWHVHESAGDTDEKLIGVYATREDALAAIDRLKDKPGFRDAPSGFEISEYTVGKDHWTEGYISWAEAAADADG